MARVVYSHEPEPEGSGMLYGGEEVEAGMEAEEERSMSCTMVVVVGGGGRWGWMVEDEGGGTNKVGL